MEREELVSILLKTKICVDLTKGVQVFPSAHISLIPVTVELFPVICWTGTWQDLEWAVKKTSTAALSAGSSGAGSVRAAGAANIYGESEESLNDDELGKNVKASKITRLLSWSRYRSLKEGATGFL